jgi:hypothetical protein
MVFKLKLPVVVVVVVVVVDDDDATAAPALLLLLCCCYPTFVPQIPSAFNTVSQVRFTSYENANRAVF